MFEILYFYSLTWLFNKNRKRKDKEEREKKVELNSNSRRVLCSHKIGVSKQEARATKSVVV